MPKRMRVFYDTEFHEDGKTIDLISIGMVREDGQEYYAVSSEFDTFRVAQNPWLMENVMSSIQHEVIGANEDGSNPISMLVTDPAAKDRLTISRDILSFTSDIWPEFWAWYGAYDHVALCQLYGRMIDLPNKFPMFTMDIRQEYKRLGEPLMPKQPDGLHNALDDARWNVVRWQYLRGIEERRLKERVVALAKE